MKFSKWIVLILLLDGFSCFGQTTPAAMAEEPTPQNPGYTITVTQPASAFHLGSPIKITLTVKNITDKDIFWSARWETGEDGVYKEFRYLLKKDGKEVETTFFHRYISNRQRTGDPNEVDSGSSILFPKPPGIIFVVALDLKRLYDISEPGQYTLDISRFAEDNKTIVHANVVTLNIVP
jgi:hypothetical protein